NIKVLLTFCFILIDCAKWTFYLWMTNKMDKHSLISMGDMIPFIGGNQIYLKFAMIVGDLYACLTVILFHPGVTGSTATKLRKEFKWIELFRCLNGDFPLTMLQHIKQEDGELLRKGNLFS